MQPRRAFHGNFAPCLERLSDQLLCRYEVTAVALPFLRNKPPGRQDCRQQFLCRYEVALRNKTAAQFVTVHFFIYRNCNSTDLSKIEAGCRNMPIDKNSSTKFATRTANSSTSVTSLLLNIAKHCITILLNIAKHCITNRLISLQQEFSMLCLGKLPPHQRQLFSREENVILILSQTVLEGIAVLAVKQTQRVCSRTSFRTELYFCVRTQTDCSAWRPEKASIDSISFFFVNAVKTEQSSIIYNVGSPINT